MNKKQNCSIAINQSVSSTDPDCVILEAKQKIQEVLR